MPRIENINGNISTSGLNLKEFDPVKVAAFRVAFSFYGKLVEQDEQLTGRQWVNRIRKVHADLSYVRKACATILEIMGDDGSTDDGVDVASA